MGELSRRHSLGTAGRVALLASLALAAGCATSHGIDLTYKAVPTENMARTPGVTVHVAEFEDRRAEPDVVGEIQSGFWESTVRADEKIRPRQGTAATWVRNALVAELKLRGFDVAGADAKPEYLVRGSILELSYTEGGWLVTRPGAVITIECELEKDGRVLFVEQYWRSATAKTRPGDPPQLLETVLRRNLRNFLGDLQTHRKGGGEAE